MRIQRHTQDSRSRWFLSLTLHEVVSKRHLRVVFMAQGGYPSSMIAVIHLPLEGQLRFREMCCVLQRGVETSLWNIALLLLTLLCNQGVVECLDRHTFCAVARGTGFTAMAGALKLPRNSSSPMSWRKVYTRSERKVVVCTHGTFKQGVHSIHHKRMEVVHHIILSLQPCLSLGPRTG